MKQFLLILILTYFGFAEAFLRLKEGSDNDKFLPTYSAALVYTFRMSIVDNNTEEFENLNHPITAWLLFIACTLFTNIVLLNLLITIIGKSYEEVESQQEIATLKERVDLIVECEYMLENRITERLIIVTEVEEEKDSLNQKLQNIMNAQIKFETKIQQTQDMITDAKGSINSISETLNQTKNEIGQFKDMMTMLMNTMSEENLNEDHIQKTKMFVTKPKNLK